MRRRVRGRPHRRIENETIDHGSGAAGDLLDWANIPGGGIVRDVGDAAGDAISDSADWVGNRAEDVADFITPWR